MKRRKKGESGQIALVGVFLLGTLWTVWVVAVRGADNGVPVRRVARGAAAPTEACAAVDVVLTWVNGSAPAHRAALRGVLAHDPRPSYQSDPERMYGVAFAGKNVKFTVEDGVLTVRKIEEI